MSKGFLMIAVGFYAVFWLALAIHPLDRGDWFLENLLIFVSVAVLGLTYRQFQFSNASYLLILVFLAFHTIGAHYTYAKVPAGFWLEHCLHLSRNHYDRVIHFTFGFLLIYPMTELLARSGRVKESWAPWLAMTALWALSSFFEILEAIVAMIVRPDLGAAYLGTQGDIWDAQKDMCLRVCWVNDCCGLANHSSSEPLRMNQEASASSSRSKNGICAGLIFCRATSTVKNSARSTSGNFLNFPERSGNSIANVFDFS